MNRSSQLDPNKYDTDKKISGFFGLYDRLFDPLFAREISLLELGVFKGGSLSYWADYFPKGTIVGVDLQPPVEYVAPERVHVFQANQLDLARLSQIAGQTAPGGFDIIIDDASHVGHFTKLSFWHLFNNHLKPGGIFIIEDWGTGYWDHWMDGVRFSDPGNSDIEPIHEKLRHGQKAAFPNHSYGMVGFVKQLVDEVGAGDATNDKEGLIPRRASRFESLEIHQGVVVVRKCAATA